MPTDRKLNTATTIVIVVFFVALLVSFVVFQYSMVSAVMTKTSPDGRHNAKLIRTQGIDVNFRVLVDGRKVYWSPDFAPVESDFREHIAWDKSGQIVILSIAGENIFGFHAAENRTLEASELSGVEFTPFDELGFEGKREDSDRDVE